MSEKHLTIAPRLTPPQNGEGKFQRGSVLLLVLIVVTLLTLSGMALFDRMFSEHQGSRAYGRQVQSRYLAESGVEYLKAYLAQTPTLIKEGGGIYDNPARFRAVLVSDGGLAAFRGRFTVLAPGLNTNGFLADVRSGLQDESARLNLNTVGLADSYVESGGRNQLMFLPGMTESIADAILDWIDEDDDPRPLGAEREYYSSLDPAYAPSNGPLETVEQLLLVRDVTPELLFGVDVNRNGLMDTAEAVRAKELGIDDPDGAAFRGWAAYLTVHSAEANTRLDGTPKIDVNMDDLAELHKQLSTILDAEKANFIVAYRQGGAHDEDGPTKIASSVTINFEEEGRVKINSILDLVGVKTAIAVPGGGGQGGGATELIAPAFAEESGAMRSYLPELMENLTAISGETIPGRLNINQAPRPLLEGLPGMTFDVVDRIIANRDVEFRTERPDRAYETWILADGFVTLDQMKRLLPLICAGGDVYRAQVVGYYDEEGPAVRTEVILDATKKPATIVDWRELKDLGPGYSPELLGIEPDVP
jgi:DNA uptake protein ComE-like DNA-binding protein